MPYQIGLKLWSTNTGAYRDEALRLYDEGVYDYIELYAVPNSVESIPLWKELKHIPFIIHHPHFVHGFNLANAANAAENRLIYEQSKRFADELDARFIIFHGGMDGSVEECAKQLASLREERALIENKPFVVRSNALGGQFCCGATFEELRNIIHTAGCGFCLDIGHAVCSANSQGKEPYSFIHELSTLNPAMFHMSDVEDMSSVYDAHPHLGTGCLDIERLKRDIFPGNAVISVETDKSSKTNLDDFKRDALWMRNC